jgi:hypothetical protein
MQKGKILWETIRIEKYIGSMLDTGLIGSKKSISCTSNLPEFPEASTMAVDRGERSHLTSSTSTLPKLLTRSHISTYQEDGSIWTVRR